MRFKLAPAIKTRWLRALRSMRYKKGYGQLVSPRLNKFCCLGVLADIQGAEFDVERDHFLPMPVGQKAGFYLDKKLACGLSRARQLTLARINDASSTFDPVIEYIEKRL